MKLIIAGGRRYRFTGADKDFLMGLMDVMLVDEVVSGGGGGADNEGECFAVDHDINVKHFHANWDKHGKAAGPIRNKEMAKYADAVVLFPGGRGTDSMFKEASAQQLIIYDKRKS